MESNQESVKMRRGSQGTWTFNEWTEIKEIKKKIPKGGLKK